MLLYIQIGFIHYLFIMFAIKMATIATYYVLEGSRTIVFQELRRKTLLLGRWPLCAKLPCDLACLWQLQALFYCNYVKYNIIL